MDVRRNNEEYLKTFSIDEYETHYRKAANSALTFLFQKKLPDGQICDTDIAAIEDNDFYAVDSAVQVLALHLVRLGKRVLIVGKFHDCMFDNLSLMKAGFYTRREDQPGENIDQEDQRDQEDKHQEDRREENKNQEQWNMFVETGVRWLNFHTPNSHLVQSSIMMTTPKFLRSSYKKHGDKLLEDIDVVLLTDYTHEDEMISKAIKAAKMGCIIVVRYHIMRRIPLVYSHIHDWLLARDRKYKRIRTC